MTEISDDDRSRHGRVPTRLNRCVRVLTTRTGSSSEDITKMTTAQPHVCGVAGGSRGHAT